MITPVGVGTGVCGSAVSSHLEQSSEDYQDPDIWLILSTLILFSPSCFVAFVLPVFLNKMPSVLM